MWRGPTVDVLVVEDQKSLRDLFSTTLSRYFPGVQVLAVNDGAQAVAEMERGCVPRLVLTNIAMPNMDGVALLHWMRTERPGVPVIGISVGPAVGGFDDLLQKPVELGEFLECMRDWLQVELIDPGPEARASIIL